MKEKIINYWHSLNKRQKIVLGIGVILSILNIVYSLIYALMSLLADKEVELQEKYADFQWMKTVVKSDTFKMVKLPLEKKLTFLTKELQDEAWKNYPYQLQESEKGEVQLNFAKAPYGLFMAWLQNMNTNHGVLVKKLAIEKTGTPGIVKISLLLQ